MTTTLAGRIAFRDIEMGVWVLEADDGQTYLLAGGNRKLKQPGRRVEATGEVEGDRLTAQMVGPRFVVDTYRFVD
jgi:hypothetical protein